MLAIMKPRESIKIENIDHLGLVAGIIDEIDLVEQIILKSNAQGVLY